MSSLRPDTCPVTGETEAHVVFRYDAPPAGEIGFRRKSGQPYYREVWQFRPSRHFVGRHQMEVDTDYRGGYVDATYEGGAGIAAAFERVIALPPERSDNAGRIERVRQFAQEHFRDAGPRSLLDVGSGIGVFPYAVRQIGWSCTAVDPDPRAVDHLRSRVGAEAVCGDFRDVSGIGTFDIITFNKVLEHVEDPVSILARARDFLAPGGFVYVELPDGEEAAAEGAGREEFFVEHLHVFSFVSIAMLVQRAGFTPHLVERLREPSSKLTLRAFAAAGRSSTHE